MNLEELKSNFYFPGSESFGRIFTFVDFGNVRPWAENFWPEENKKRINTEIDIKKLSEVCDWLKPRKKIFYYGHFAEREDLNREHKFNVMHKDSIFRLDRARKSGFQVKSKEVKLIPIYDDKGNYVKKMPKCNFDVEITMDMLTKIQKYDTVVLFSGDSDFALLLKYLKTKNKKIVIVCTRKGMSRELDEVSDLFIPAESLKKFLKLER